MTIVVNEKKRGVEWLTSKGDRCALINSLNYFPSHYAAFLLLYSVWFSCFFSSLHFTSLSHSELSVFVIGNRCHNFFLSVLFFFCEFAFDIFGIYCSRKKLFILIFIGALFAEGSNLTFIPFIAVAADFSFQRCSALVMENKVKWKIKLLRIKESLKKENFSS